jgi:hypothetical protein
VVFRGEARLQSSLQIPKISGVSYKPWTGKCTGGQQWTPLAATDGHCCLLFAMDEADLIVADVDEHRISLLLPEQFPITPVGSRR